MGRTKVVFSLMYNEIARRLLLKQELSEISQAMCVKEETLSRILRKPEFKETLELLQERVYRGLDQSLVSDARNLREEMQKAAFTSFDRLCSLQKTAASESIVVNISQDLLDRAGYGKTTKIVEERIVKIDSLDAEVLAAALAREKEGRANLNQKGVDDLLKSGKDVPIGKYSVTDSSK